VESTKYIGMDVHKETISTAVMNAVGKVVIESIPETNALTILQFVQGLRGNLQITFEESCSNVTYSRNHIRRRENESGSDQTSGLIYLTDARKKD
jgi:hypothetical protein